MVLWFLVELVPSVSRDELEHLLGGRHEKSMCFCLGDLFELPDPYLVLPRIFHHPRVSLFLPELPDIVWNFEHLSCLPRHLLFAIHWGLSLGLFLLGRTLSGRVRDRPTIRVDHDYSAIWANHRFAVKPQHRANRNLLGRRRLLSPDILSVQLYRLLPGRYVYGFARVEFHHVVLPSVECRRHEPVLGEVAVGELGTVLDVVRVGWGGLLAWRCRFTGRRGGAIDGRVFPGGFLLVEEEGFGRLWGHVGGVTECPCIQRTSAQES